MTTTREQLNQWLSEPGEEGERATCYHGAYMPHWEQKASIPENEGWIARPTRRCCSNILRTIGLPVQEWKSCGKCCQHIREVKFRCYCVNWYIQKKCITREQHEQLGGIQVLILQIATSGRFLLQLLLLAKLSLPSIIV